MSEGAELTAVPRGRPVKPPPSEPALAKITVETRSSVVVEEARWESRHLLQEIYDNESKLYSESEKNCTEPGKTCFA